VALIAESGARREDRQKMILEGWRDAIIAGRYTAVLYDCTSASVTLWITRLAKKVRLTPPSFSAAIQPSAQEIAALPPAVLDDEPAVEDAKPSGESARAPDQEVNTAPARAPAPPEPVQLAPARAAAGTGARDRRGRRGARATLPRDLRHGRTEAPPPMAPPTLNPSTSSGQDQ
jgi:hypothetical protein